MPGYKVISCDEILQSMKDKGWCFQIQTAGKNDRNVTDTPQLTEDILSDP